MYDIIERAKKLACTFDLPVFIVKEGTVIPVRSGNLDSRLFSAIHFMFSSNLVSGTPLNPPFFTHLIRYTDKFGLTTLNVSEITKDGITNVVFGPVLCGQYDRNSIVEAFLALPEVRFSRDEAFSIVESIPHKDTDFLDSWGDVALTFLETPRTLHTSVRSISSDGRYFRYDGMVSSDESRMMESDIYALYALDNEIGKLVALGDKDKLKRLVIEQGGFSLKGRSKAHLPFSLADLKKRLIEMNTRFRISAEEAGLSPIQVHMVYETQNGQIDRLQNPSERDVVLSGMIDMYCNAVNSMNLGDNSANVLRVKRYIGANLDDKLSVETLADMVGLNVSYLCRLFKKESHMTIGQYIQMSRMNEAKWLLETTDKPMMEIALAVGFNDQSHFSQVFNRHFGMTPSEYRKKRRL